MQEKVLEETTEVCLECPNREKCLEEACVLFRIEKIIEDNKKE